jgi:hypothetical protein
MSARLRALALPVAATAAYLAFAGAAQAGTTSISGTVPNGGCSAARPVPVAGPSRIEVAVSANSADTSSIVGEILAPDGRTVATGSFDTSGGGAYAVRVCSLFSSLDPPQLQYSGLLGTGPAGQPAIPKQQAEVLGTTATIITVGGKGAILTRAGLAWFTVHMTPSGMANIVVFDPVHHKSITLLGMSMLSGTNSVLFTGNGVKLFLVGSGKNIRLTFTSRTFKASGKVVRGGFQLAA